MKNVIAAILLGFLFILSGCFTKEYTVSPTPAKNITIPSNPIQSAASFDKLQNSRFGWVLYDQNPNIIISKLPGGYVREYPGNFLWQKVQLNEHTLEYSQTDIAVKTAQNANKILVPQLWPLSKVDQGNCRPKAVPECQVPITDVMNKRGKENYLPLDRCSPCNLSTYYEFVREIVERYDGDGKGDMPTLLYPLKVWEFYDQPTLKKDSLTYFKGTQQDYEKILNTTYVAMKDSCPTCQLLSSAITEANPETVQFMTPVYESGQTDIVNLQAPFSDIPDLGLIQFKSAFPETTKPVWMTNANFYHIAKESGVADLSGRIVSSCAEAFTQGAQKILIGDEIIYARAELMNVVITMIDNIDDYSSVEMKNSVYIFSFADGHKVYLGTGSTLPLKDESHVKGLDGQEAVHTNLTGNRYYYEITSAP
jgi:hypothetical protein